MDTATAQDGPGVQYLKDHKLLFLAAGVSSLVIIKAVLDVIYNVYFCPLRKYPGPKAAAATALVYWYHYLRGDTASWTEAQHQKYGEAVRVAPDRLSFIHPQAWKDIYGHRIGAGMHAANRKDHRFYVNNDTDRQHLVATLDDAEHARVRRIFSHAFSDRGLKAQEPLIRRYVDALVQRALAVPAAEGKPVDMLKLYNCTTFDIMGDLTFGEPLGLLDATELSPWVASIFKNIKVASFSQFMYEYSLLGSIFFALVPASLKKMASDHHRFSTDRVDRRLERQKSGGVERPDIWGLVLRQEESKGLDLEDMHANGSLFMIAGTETSASTLSGLTFLLLKNPDKYDKLVKEIRSSFASADELTMENLRRLPYLNACIEESLRVYPVVPAGLPRVIPPGGNAIMGEWIPEGTRVSIPQWAAFRSARNFKDPLSFVPERWLPDGGYDQDRKDAYQPFSYGPRNCIGQNLANHEMRVIMGNILWHYDLKLAPGMENWNQQKVYVVWEKPPLMVTVKPKA